MKRTLLLLLIFSAFSLTSCNLLLKSTVGLNPIKKFDQEKYEKTRTQLMDAYSGTSESVLLSDTAFLKYFAQFDSIPENLAKQPIQILYFNQEKILKSFHANCLAPLKGTSTLNWNVENRFEKYFPESATSVKDETRQLDDYFKTLKINSKELNSKKDVILVFWTNMLKKQVLKANEVIIKNTELAEELPQIIYINTDKFWASLYQEKMNDEFMKNNLTEEEYEKIKRKDE